VDVSHVAVKYSGDRPPVGIDEGSKAHSPSMAYLENAVHHTLGGVFEAWKEGLYALSAGVNVASTGNDSGFGADTYSTHHDDVGALTASRQYSICAWLFPIRLSLVFPTKESYVISFLVNKQVPPSILWMVRPIVAPNQPPPRPPPRPYPSSTSRSRILKPDSQIHICRPEAVQHIT
jgi:hypothetical protein